MDASIVDSVQGYAAGVKSNGELRVTASVPGTVEVNIASTSDQIETTPGAASSVNQGQVPVGSSTGGTSIVAAGSRKGLLVTNMDASKTVYIGFGSTPTTTDSFPVAPGATVAFPAGVTNADEIKGITTTGTVRVAYAEFV